jgi:putative DNA primase/helicase
MLAAGKGKVRANRTGAAVAEKQWTLMFLSTGEIGLREHMLRAGVKVKGGQEARCLDIPAQAGTGFGIFTKLCDGEREPSRFADRLTEASHQFYGVAGRENVRAIAADRDGTRQKVLRQIDAFVEEEAKKHELKNASGEVRRALSRFPLVAAAGELATERNITRWEKGEATKAASICFGAYLSQRGGRGAGDIEAGIRQVKAFIERHGSSRFATTHPDPDSRPVFQRAGFYQGDNKCGFTYLVLPNVFRDEVCSGYDYKDIVRTLASKGQMEHDRDKLTKKVRLPGFTSATNVFVILASLFDDEPEVEERSAEPKEEDMEVALDSF